MKYLLMFAALLAVVMGSFPYITSVDCTNNVWKYHDDAGFKGWITFLSNFTAVTTFPSTIKTWTIEQTSVVGNLTLSDGNGNRMVSIANWKRDYYSKWRGKGRSLTSILPQGASIYL